MAPAEPISSTNGSKCSISKLACNGSNWITCKSQTLMTLAASCGVMQHIKGTAWAPPTIPTFPPTAHSLWMKKSNWREPRSVMMIMISKIIKVQIFTSIPDSLLSTETKDSKGLFNVIMSWAQNNIVGEILAILAVGLFWCEGGP